MPFLPIKIHRGSGEIHAPHEVRDRGTRPWLGWKGRKDLSDWFNLVAPSHPVP